MRGSLGSTKPTGEMKVKTRLSRLGKIAASASFRRRRRCARYWPVSSAINITLHVYNVELDNIINIIGPYIIGPNYVGPNINNIIGP